MISLQNAVARLP